ncbi:unnamed protein product [Amaranthus hypochondriacus]
MVGCLVFGAGDVRGDRFLRSLSLVLPLWWLFGNGGSLDFRFVVVLLFDGGLWCLEVLMSLFGLASRTGAGRFDGGVVFESRVAGVSGCWYSVAFHILLGS